MFRQLISRRATQSNLSANVFGRTSSSCSSKHPQSWNVIVKNCHINKRVLKNLQTFCAIFFYFFQIFRILVTVSCRGIRATSALQLISYDYVCDSYMCHFFKTPSDLCSFLPDLTLSSIVKLICWYLRLLVKTTAADVDLSILKPSLRVKREWRFRVQKR